MRYHTIKFAPQQTLPKGFKVIFSRHDGFQYCGGEPRVISETFNTKWAARRACLEQGIDEPERFDSMLVKGIGPNRDCWEWAGGRIPTGYGIFCSIKGHVVAHRYAWELSSGEKVPDGLLVLHSCDNPPCCNPDHLSLGDHVENMRQKVERGRTSNKRFRKGDKKNFEKGENNILAKITDNEALFIYKASNDGVLTISELARKFKISKGLVGRIKNGKKWAHVTMPESTT